MGLNDLVSFVMCTTGLEIVGFARKEAVDERSGTRRLE
jgi:hypothetical protein